MAPCGTAATETSLSCANRSTARPVGPRRWSGTSRARCETTSVSLGYANDVSSIEGFARQLDQEDGKLDGLWRDNSIEQLRSGFDTPARTPYQTQLIEAIVKRERFGKDDVPDLLYLNYKAIDGVGHAFGLDSVEMQDSVRYQDDALRELVAFLNDQVGEGEWVMALTADHGAQSPPTSRAASQSTPTG